MAWRGERALIVGASAWRRRRRRQGARRACEEQNARALAFTSAHEPIVAPILLGARFLSLCA